MEESNNTQAENQNSIILASIAAKKDKQALAGFILGLVGIVAWFLPIIGLPVTVIGLVMSILGLKSAKRGKLAIAGLVLCVLFLVITIANSAIGAYQGYLSALESLQ